MKTALWLTAACISTAPLLGCQAVMYGTAADLNKLEIGMTKDDVVSRMGSPLSTEASGELREQRLVYKRMANVTGWLPTYYDVVLRDGKVVAFGERRY